MPVTANSDRNLRVLYAINDLNGGGAQRAAIQLTEFLRAAGDDSKIWAVTPTGAYLEQYAPELFIHPSCEGASRPSWDGLLELLERAAHRLQAKPIGSKIQRLRFQNIAQLRQQLRSQFAPELQGEELEKILNTCFDLRAIARLKQVINNFQPDIILSSIPDGATQLVFNTLALEFANSRSLIWIAVEQNNPWERGKYYYQTAEAQEIWRQLTSIYYQRADHVVAVSQGVKNCLVQRYAIAPEQVSVIHNAADLEIVQAKAARLNNDAEFVPQKPFMLAIGRLHPQKGFDRLVQAYAQVIDQIDADLVILGDGVEKETLLQQVQTLGLQDRIHFPGFVSNPWFFLSNALCFVLSSRFEGLPLVIPEAMACGCPVIAFDCDSGPSDIIQNDHDGILVAADDVSALAQAMQRLCNSPDLQKKYASNGVAKAHTFDVNLMGSAYQTLIRSYLQGA